MKNREKIASIFLIILALVSVFIVMRGADQGQIAPFGSYPERPAGENAFHDYSVAISYYENYQRELAQENYFDEDLIREVDEEELLGHRPDYFGEQSISKHILREGMFSIQVDDLEDVSDSLDDEVLPDVILQRFEDEGIELMDYDLEKIIEGKRWRISMDDNRYLIEASDDEFEVYVNKFVEDTGAANSITAILWDYRGYDTLGEATVIFVAVAGIAALFRKSEKGDEE